MKNNILKAEVIFQILVSLISLLYVMADYQQKTLGSEFFIALFYVGVSNLIGFLLRVSLSKSKFHRYYFFGVILFFIILYILAVSVIDSKTDFIMYFMGAGGVLFNIYYLAYGFYLAKNNTAK